MRKLSTSLLSGIKRTAGYNVAHGIGILLWSVAMTLLLVFPHRQPERFAIFATFGMCVATAIFTVFHVRHSALKIHDRKTVERLIGLISLLTVVGIQIIPRSAGASEMMGIGFLLTGPLVAHAMLVSALLGPAASLFTLTATSFLLGFSGTMSVELLTASWLTGAVGAHAVNPLKQRSDLLRATTIQVVACAIMACFATANRVSTVGPVLESAGWAAATAFGAASVFWLAIALVERAFGVISDWSLLELCSPDHPLIRDLCLMAPGTYAHSVMVANLAENAARTIGANPVQCRAMAYFHDVGKTMRPAYFIENQYGENLHDHMPPALSAQVIAKHVTDGIELAKKHKLPQILIDAIAQHHGTMLISFFYARAIKQDKMLHDPEFEKLFRYAGTKPQTRETAILMLCDQIEAVSRTISSSSPEELEMAVMRIIENTRAEGQLDESELTFKDVGLIQTSILRSLGALRHERIAYPELRSEYESEEPTPDSDFERHRDAASKKDYRPRRP